MQTTFALAALVSVAFATPQGGPVGKAPEAPSPPGCQKNFDGEFQITILNGSSTVTKRDASTCGKEGFLTAKLADGVLTDHKGRTGSIVANRQFQFDGPPQAGAVYTAGFSVCQNNSLAIGGTTIFYSCRSGDFSNLYDTHWAPQCEPVFIDVLPCAASGGGSGAGHEPDKQPNVIPNATPASQIPDGQAQVPTYAPNPPASQINDGQVQVPTHAPLPPVVQIGDGQLQLPAAIPISQIPDGQLQGPTALPGPPASKIPDAPVTVPTANLPPATQIPDGQVQVPTAAPLPTPSHTPGNASTPTPPLQVNPNSANGLVVGSLATVLVGLVTVLLL